MKLRTHAPLPILGLALALAAPTGCSKPKPAQAPEAAAPAPAVAEPAESLRASRGGIELPDDVPFEVVDLVLSLPTQRGAAVNGLAALAPKPDQALALLLASDNVEEVTGALEYFERTKGKAGAAAAKLVDHPVPSLRRQALLTLIAVGASDKAAEVTKALDDQDSTVRSLAIRALSSFGGAVGPQALIDKLEDREEQVTTEVAVALASRKDEAVAPKLAEKLDSPKVATVVGALTALRLLEAPIAPETLAKLLADGRPEVAMAAARALPRAGDKAAELIAKALADARPELRRIALEVSGALPADEAITAAKKASEDTSPWVRAASLEVLATRLPEAERVRALVPLLHDDAREVRQAAAVHLGHTSAEAVTPLLGRLAAERDRMTRLVVVRALGQLKSPAAVEPLIGVLEAPKVQDRYMVARALKAITGQAFGNDAKRWRQWQASQGGAPAPKPAPTKPAAPDPAGG